MAAPGAKQRIAILGGGTGSLVAAFELTEQPGWQDRYELTVYQLGWRLGGKGASGRNAAADDRIEEHGLHVLGGFYENAFQVMRRCYAEVGRKPGEPLATVWEAFKPKNDVLWEEFIDGRWIHWPVHFPDRPGLPGSGTDVPPLHVHLRAALAWLKKYVCDTLDGELKAVAGELELPRWLDSLLVDAVKFGAEEIEVSFVAVESTLFELGHSGLHLALALAEAYGSDAHAHPATAHHGICWLLKQFKQWLYDRISSLIDRDDAARRCWIVADFTIAAICGMLADGVLLHDWDVINDENWIDWLKRHGASPLTLGSAIVRGFHDYFFAFEEGDPQRPSLEAGIAMRQLMRLAMTYQGAVFWEMQAGMGDTVFAPLYLVLKKRGVKFKFFHQVENLELSDDKKSVARIKIARQVNIRDGKDYNPLTVVKNLQCWPSEPEYQQIVEAAELHRRRIDLESPWSDWQPVERVTLEQGRDFDLVVLGTSFEPLKYICGELIGEDLAWRTMIERVKTCQTIAAQLWYIPTAEVMGSLPGALMTGYAQVLQTWGDFSHLIPRENWPAGNVPGNLSYFCGVLPDEGARTDFAVHDFPAIQSARAKQITIQWIRGQHAHLFPRANAPFMEEPGLNWNLLYDPKGGLGRERFNAQYWRANISPAERYVLSVPGSSKYRLLSGDSRFTNLYLAGDWTFTGLGGSIEGAAISGMMASRAICGYPQRIIGEVSRE